MATKTQVNQRYNNEQYRQRQNPSVRPEKPGQSLSVPHLASTWKSPNFDAINFMDKLFGSADALVKLAKTEEGKQYRKAQARALRGDFSIDDSGLITFKGAQQKALSEVEGTNDAAIAQDALIQASEEFRKQLAERDDLTPAQKIQAHRALLQQQAYASLSPDKDTDYLIAKGSRLNVTVNQLSNAYRDATIQSQLNEERDKTVGALQANLNMMPAGISKEAQADFMKGSLAKFAESWGIVTGQPISSASPVLRKHVNDLVAKGDRELLLRLKDFEIGKGVTMESLGIITEATLDSADRQAISLMQRDTAMRKAQAEKYVFDVGNQIYKIYQNSQKYSEMDMEKYLEQQASDLNSLAELKTAISNSSALSAEVKSALNRRIATMETGIQSGGQIGEMSMDDRVMLNAMHNSGNMDGVIQYFRENPFVDCPQELVWFKQEAMKGTSVTEMQKHKTWVSGVLARTLMEDQGSAEDNRAYKARMQADLNDCFNLAREENPTASVSVIQQKALEQFRKTYKELPVEKAVEVETLQNMNTELNGNLKTMDSRVIDVVTEIANSGKVPMAEKLQLKKAIRNNSSLSGYAKNNIEALIGGVLKKDALVVDDVNNTYLNFPLNPKYPVQGAERFSKKTDTAVFVKDKQGRPELRPFDTLTSTDQGKILTFPMPSNGVYYDDRTGELKPLAELTNSEQYLKRLVTKQRPPIRPDGGTEQNPVARDLSGWEHGNGMKIPNLSNQDLPLEDHYVLLRGSLDTYQVKRYGSIPDVERADIISLPFDPDMTVAVREGLTSSTKFRKMRDIGSHLRGNRKYIDFVSPMSLENMSFQDQLDAFTPEPEFEPVTKEEPEKK